MDYYRPVRRSAIRSRLLTNALVRKGLLGRKGRYSPLKKKVTTRKPTASRTLLSRRPRAKLAIQNVKQTPGLTSHSRFSVYHPPNRQALARKRVGAPNFYVTNSAQQIVALEGFQAVGVTPWQNNTDMSFMLAKVPQGPTVGSVGTRSISLESAQCELLFTNSSLASCFVEVYDIARRRDADKTKSPYTADPFSAWSQGVSDNQASVTPTGNITNLKSLPFDSQLFKDWFKVCKRTRFELSQGATHRHSVSIKANRIIDEAVLAYADGDMAGITMYTMFVVYGQPASIPGEGGKPPSTVTTATIALDVVSSIRYKFTWVSDPAQTQWFQDNLSTLTGEQIASPGLGDLILNKVV